jgi:hypothetical protein
MRFSELSLAFSENPSDAIVSIQKHPALDALVYLETMNKKTAGLLRRFFYALSLTH